MLFATALKEGVTGPDFTGNRNYKYKNGEQRLLLENQRGYYEKNPDCFKLIESTGVVASTGTNEIVTPDGKIQKIKPNLTQSAIRVAYFGHSTANLFNAVTAPDNQQIDTVTATYPATGLQTTLTKPQEKCMLESVFPQVHVVGNFGISGQTSAQMLARDTQAFSPTRRSITDVGNVNADTVIIRGGSINALVNATSSNWQAVADAEFADHKQVLQRMLQVSPHIIEQGEYGYSVANANGDYIRLALLRFNALNKAYCETQENIDFLDPQEQGIQAPDGNFMPNTSADGLHLHNGGGYLSAIGEAAALQRRYGFSGNIRYKGVNLISNPLFVNSTGGVPTGLNYSYAGCTVANQKIETTDNQVWHTLEVSNNNSTNNFSFDLSAMLAGVLAAAPAGAVYGAEVDWFIEPISNNVIIGSGTYFRWTTQKAGAGAIRVASGGLYTGFSPLTQRLKYHYFTQPFVLPEAGANLSVAEFKPNVVTLSAGDVYKVGVSAPRLVRLS